MSAAHTPGPWRAVKQSAWGVVAHKLPRGGQYRRIAQCGSPRAYPDTLLDAQDEANAHLIAAAPEILEALERILDWLSHSSVAASIPKAVAAAARAALSKAESRQ